MTAQKIKNLFSFSVVLLLISCETPIHIGTYKKNLADVYNPGSSRIHPSFTVYHSQNSISILFIKIFPSELLFSQANPSADFVARVRIHYELNEIKKNGKNELADSSTYNFILKKGDAKQRFITQVPLKADTGKIYELEITSSDMIRNNSNTKFIMVDKRSEYSQQNFLVKNKEGIPFFSPYVLGNSLFRIDHRKINIDSIYMKYYKNDFPLPRPTFYVASEEKYYEKPDSIWKLPYSRNRLYQFNYQGMFYLQMDTTHKEGLSVFNYGSDFPRVEDPEELIKPLAFITTSAEYKALLEAPNKKLAVDNFWLNAGGSADRARELIRIYYNRVYFANYYFTSNRPGWKTDRGMIYIVYGPPQNMQRSGGEETWIYYRKGDSSSITFKFDYVPSPYTLDNFVLQRSENYDWHWRDAVNSWRSGKVYLVD